MTREDWRKLKTLLRAKLFLAMPWSPFGWAVTRNEKWILSYFFCNFHRYAFLTYLLFDVPQDYRIQSHYTPEGFENATVTAFFSNLFEENTVREINSHDYIVFEKLRTFSNCFQIQIWFSPLWRAFSEFQCSVCVTVSVNGRPNRKNYY